MKAWPQSLWMLSDDEADDVARLSNINKHDGKS